MIPYGICLSLSDLLHLVSSSSLFFSFFIYFYKLEANYFTILYWFLSYIDMNQPWIYMCSPSRSPLPPPSPPDPSGSSQCTRSEHLSSSLLYQAYCLMPCCYPWDKLSTWSREIYSERKGHAKWHCHLMLTEICVCTPKEVISQWNQKDGILHMVQNI